MTMVWRGVLADLLVVLHAAYASFIVLGLVAILLGIAFRWRWVRNRWFRSIHIAMIGIVVGETVAGIKCPLTVWERQLREAAGQVAYPGDFIGYWTHHLLFYDPAPWVLPVLYTAVGMAILAAFIFAPPRWKADTLRPPAG
jgi:hypothetical protein